MFGFVDYAYEIYIRHGLYSVIKFFQVDITGMVRMTSSARYFNGSSLKILGKGE